MKREMNRSFRKTKIVRPGRFMGMKLAHLKVQKLGFSTSTTTIVQVILMVLKQGGVETSKLRAIKSIQTKASVWGLANLATTTPCRTDHSFLVGLLF